MSTVTEKNFVNKPQQKLNKQNEANGWYANGAFVIATHLLALYALIFHTPASQTKWLTFVLWQLASLGITMGYHRLWSHRAFTARLPLRMALGVMGTLGFQGSIKWWVLRHRLHHRGFWFSHILWIFQKPRYTKMKSIDSSDLVSDPAFFFGFILPTVIGSLWNDALGGFLYGGVICRILSWHGTFSINSFAHWTGEQLYSNEISARGNLLLAIITGGEGYHNFHHEFPKDYRNGYRIFDYDPTKWYKLDWGVDPSSLPVISYSEYNKTVNDEGKDWFVIDDFVLDIAEFKESHPGGAKILKAFYGKDASKAFHGGLNIHSRAANTMLAMFRVAKIDRSLDKQD
nr:15132_t:CDS:2 [Entrophospora candida]